MMKKLLLFILITLIPVIGVSKTETAIFAGGCFWCLEADFDKLNGVVSTQSGYDGGTQKNPTYESVSSGTTNYAESVRVIYDSDKVTYQELLNYFWHHIDPTQNNGQFCDHGKQYRSEIFYLNDDQKTTALNSLAKIKKRFNHVYTTVEPSTHFYPAETYHQDYYKKNPIRYKYYRWCCGRDEQVKNTWNNVPQNIK